MCRKWTMMLAALLVCAAILPVCALAETVQVSEEAQAACIQAGGQLLAAPRLAQVASPYGTQSVVLRDAPSDSYDAVAMLMVGQEVTAVGTSGEFYFVLLGDGGTGWLAEDEIK